MKRLKFVLVTCVVMGIVTAAFAGWEELESLPDARYGGVLVSDGTYLYYFGGSKDFFNDARDDVYRYNPATDTWDTRADMPQGVIYPSGGIVGNSVYLSGGYYYPYTHTNDTQIFDISGNTWSAGYDFPFVGYGAGAAVIGNDIYHLGGYDYGTFYNLDDVNIYDTVGDTWSAGDTMEEERWTPAAFSDGTNLYAVGGNNAGFAPLAQSSVWTPTVDGTWTDGDMADLPVPVAAAGYAGWYDSVGDNWYFFLLGGRTTGFTLIQTVHKYDLDADTWTTECEGLPVVQQYTSSAYDDGYIYAAGGANDDGDALDWFARLPVDDCEPAPTTTTTTVTTTTTTTTIPGDDDTGDDDTGDDDADDDATDDDMDDDADDDASDDDDDDDDDAADDDDDDDDDDDGGCCGC